MNAGPTTVDRKGKFPPIGKLDAALYSRLFQDVFRNRDFRNVRHLTIASTTYLIAHKMGGALVYLTRRYDSQIPLLSDCSFPGKSLLRTQHSIPHLHITNFMRI